MSVVHMPTARARDGVLPGSRTTMAKVTVYRVQLWDPAKGENVIIGRMATLEGAKMLKGEIIAESAVEIDASRLERGEQWTPIDFVP